MCIVNMTYTTNISQKLFDNLHSFFVQKLYFKNDNLELTPNFIHKNSKNLDSSGDFSVYTKDKPQRQFGNDVCDMKKVGEQLTEESKEWSIHVKKSIFVNGRFLIYLERQHTFQSLIGLTLRSCQQYGQQPDSSRSVLLTTDFGAVDESNLDLSNLRVLLMKRASVKLFSLMGYDVNIDKIDEIERDNHIELHFTSQATNQSNIHSNKLQFLCAAVLDTKNGANACKMMASDYYILRLGDMKAVTEYKYGGNKLIDDLHLEDILCNLSYAAVTLDLLGIQPRRAVSLNVDPLCVQVRESSSKGAAFVMYNYARISEILKQFQLKVSEGYYPPLVPIEDIDFLLLTSEDEWLLLFNFVLFYPNVIRESLEKFEQGVIRIDLICKFLDGLCGRFSVYYRRVRILTEPRIHLLPVMFARLYLLKAVKQVLSNAFNVLDIKPVTQM